jgi:HlyD family secretion protein
VMRVSPDSKVLATKVQVGRRQGDRVEVLSGVAADARVVAVGGPFLSEGDTVQVVKAAPALPAAKSATAPSAAAPRR